MLYYHIATIILSINVHSKESENSTLNKNLTQISIILILIVKKTIIHDIGLAKDKKLARSVKIEQKMLEFACECIL